MYIALDIETTGFNTERDDIIEIGATLFDKEKIIDSYSSLIHTDKLLPPLITHITGITDKDLVDAPTLNEIRTTLIEFVGDYPIVGHNIDFDLNFLEAKGLTFRNPGYDTLPLTGILIPGLPSYSLEMITKRLDIEHKDKHRALDDAIASAKLFQILIKKINEIDQDTLEEIKLLLEKSKWPLKDLFFKAHSETRVTDHKQKESKQEEKIRLKFDKDHILSFYNEDGPLSKCEHEYEVRRPQIKMTEKIIKAFEEEHNLLCEAGTGTGKSIAYLLPSIFIARSKNEKVVIATHTKNLQDQLFQKDIPVLKKVLKKEGKFDAAVLKGRGNYLSGERLNEFKQKSFFLDHEITLLIKILLWLPTTTAGDKEELSLQGREYFAWNDISCDPIRCPHHDEKYSNSCFLAKARERAQNADIIITNHALLLTETITPSPILPDHQYLVIDEAHHLEEEATRAMTINLTNELLEHPVKILKDLMRKNLDFVNKLDQFSAKIDLFFGLLGIFFEKEVRYREYANQIIINENHKQSIEWNKITGVAENLVLQGEQIMKELHEFEEDDDRLSKEIAGLHEVLNSITFVILEDGHSDITRYVTWIFQKYDGSLGIKSSPLHIGEHVKETLFHENKSTIMTSATLTTEQSFSFIRTQLSLDESWEEIILDSHFCYADQVKIVLYEHLKEPASSGYFEQSSDIILNTALENRGRMLVLFTSKKAIEATYMKLVTPLKEKGITILGQNLSGGRNKIIELFKQDPENTIIFGTNSFWEGVDIKGEALNCVVIQKLPFDPPSDPIHSARASLYENPFNDYQVPRAVLRFKQGFGRLIRSSKDSGKVIILDSRIISKPYGAAFINSLPSGIEIERSNA